MAIKRPDIYEHNNPNEPIADSNGVKGGFRSAVGGLVDLYALTPKVNQLKEYATTVWVKQQGVFYTLIDIANVDNAAGWSNTLFGLPPLPVNTEFEIINPTTFSTTGSFANGDQKVVASNTVSTPFEFSYNGTLFEYDFPQIKFNTSIDLTVSKRLDVVVLTPTGDVLLLTGQPVAVSDPSAQALSPVVDPSYYIYSYILWDTVPEVVLPEALQFTSQLTNNGSNGTSPYATVAQVAVKQDTLTSTIFGSFLNLLVSKTTPLDADTISIRDSVTGLASKLTFANLRTWLSSFFQTRDNDILISTDTVLSPIHDGKTLYVDAAVIITIPLTTNLNAEQKTCFKTKPGGQITWAKVLGTGEAVYVYGTPSPMLEKLDGLLTRERSTTNIYITTN